MNGTTSELAVEVVARTSSESARERYRLGEDSQAALERLCATAPRTDAERVAAPTQPEPGPDVEKPADPCKLVYTERPQAIDHVRGIVHRSVCATALWFDNLFGDARAFEEAERTHGLVEAGGLWKEGERVDGIGQMRIKWRFPAMKRRLHVLVGRLPEERIVAEEEDPDGLPDDLDEDEQEFVVGVEADVIKRSAHRVRPGGGLSYRDGTEPYLKVRSRSRWLLTEKTNLQLRATPYWEDGERGLGLNSILDIDTQIRPRVLMRWTATGRHDDLTDGTRYFAGPAFFHQITDTYFMAHRAGVGGETGAEIRDRSYGFVTSLRRSVLREWLFMEVSAGIDWRRETRAEAREAIGQLGFVFEMHFGDQL